MKHYNLTTIEGLKVAKEVLTSVNPFADLAVKVVEKILSSDSSKEQARIAEKLIKQGKENNVDEMEITLNNTKGLDMKIPMDGVEITTMVGSKEETVIKVKYK
ncbi:MAG: hypothetical protein IJT39_05735 [Bacteroidales bacterium]|nr:hypothetical protein [Bacteroidales bacterium]